ncbi:MAG: xanthine permease [Deltaproteobacteria bacterium]|nr:MAG: xanthine permease [Deltaproteobacteria bacterium]
MSGERNVIYGIEDKPPLRQAIVLGLQHVLTMFGATVSVPLLFEHPLGMNDQQLAILVSSVMICSGVATLIQVNLGTRLPIVQGVSFSFLAAFFACIAFAKQEAGGAFHGALAMRYIAGSIIVGSLVEMAVGYSGLIGKLRRVLSPVVIGPVIMLIGLALFEHGAPKAGTDWISSGMTIVLIILFSLVLRQRNRIFQIFPILLAILISWGFCLLMSVLGVYGKGHPAFVDLSQVGHTPWFRWNLFWGEHPILFPWGPPKFNVGLIFAVLAGFLASTIESFGDYHACSYMAGGGDPTPKQLNRGIGAEGLACFLTGFLGGFSSTSYSENIGLIGITKVGSRHVVNVGAVILLLLGVLSKFGAVVATIPGTVVGGLYCALFGLISAVGIQQLAKADLRSDRNLFIAGFSLFMGLSVPAYFSAVESTQGMLPGQMLAVYRPTAETLLSALPATLADIVKSIGSTGMAVAAIFGLILDNVIPGTDEERGIKAS